MPFVPSLELSRVLYEEQIAPLVAKRFPDVQYAAATYGMCSETLGLDDEVSMDHEWGPRVTVLLTEQDHDRCAQEMMAAFQEPFPARFKGFDAMWRQPGVDVHDTRETILYHVWTTTVDGALQFCGGAEALPLQGTPMQFLLLDLGHIDLGFDPKNEILRVYAYLGDEHTPTKEWLAACLWFNLTLMPPASLYQWGRWHKELLDAAAAQGTSIRP